MVDGEGTMNLDGAWKMDDRDNMVFDDGERPKANLTVFSRAGNYTLPAHPEETYTLQGMFDDGDADLLHSMPAEVVDRIYNAAEEASEDFPELPDTDPHDDCGDPACEECYG